MKVLGITEGNSVWGFCLLPRSFCLVLGFSFGNWGPFNHVREEDHLAF